MARAFHLLNFQSLQNVPNSLVSIKMPKWNALRSPGKYLLNQCTSNVSTTVPDAEGCAKGIQGTAPVSQVPVTYTCDTGLINTFIGTYITTCKYHSNFC